MYLSGWGNGWGSMPTDDPALLSLARLSLDGLDLDRLPEEVREAVEAHRDELHSEEDLRALVRDLISRR